MRVEMKNIGLIQNIDIQINGLTVIAGENDTGKSTVGKALFSIIKAFTRYSEDFAEENRKLMLNKIESVYFRLRKVLDYNQNVIAREEFYPPRLLKEIEFSLSVGDFESINVLLKSKIKLIENLNLSTHITEDLIHRIKVLGSSIFSTNDKSDYIKKALKLAFMSEFGSEISSKFNEEETLIKFTEGNNDILDITIIKDRIKTINSFDELYFNDATYIESPMILQMYDVISKSVAFFEEEELFTKEFNNRSLSRRPQTVFHMKDLINKMENAQYFKNINSDPQEDEDLSLYNHISNLIGGEVSFKKQQKDFVFSKKSKKSVMNIKSTNLATGIKSFGVIQLLLKAGLLHERSLLILDEPEIHLHPKWQVEYCRLIIELIKRDINVLVTTHSPYVLQALKVFVEQVNLEDSKVNFYFAEKDTDLGYGTIEDITDNLNKAFKKLSEPLQKLVWEK
jgi:predicted ATPase